MSSLIYKTYMETVTVVEDIYFTQLRVESKSSSSFSKKVNKKLPVMKFFDVLCFVEKKMKKKSLFD